MQTVTTTLRAESLAEALLQASAAERKSHERNYETLYVGTDGEVSWSEAINASDRQYYRDRPGMLYVEQVVQVGTGSVACNCDACNEIGQVLSTSGEVVDAESPDAAGGEIITQEMAIQTACENGDYSGYEDLIQEAFAHIGNGYFDDERD